MQGAGFSRAIVKTRRRRSVGIFISDNREQGIYLYFDNNMQISKLQVSRLLGSSTRTMNQVAYAQGCLLYLSGCHIIFYNPAIDQQIQYLKHSNPQINCVAVSDDEKILAVGCQGKYNNIFVYDLKDISAETPDLLYTLKGHKNGVNLLTFSNQGRYLVSVGNKDGSMFIWEKQQRLSQNRNSRMLNRVLFDRSGDLVTVGRGHCKIWPFEDGLISRVKEDDCWMINGKTLNLGKKFAMKEFIDAVSWREYLVVLTADGILCLISKKEQKLEKCIDLMMEKTTSMDLVGNLIMCGGDNSLVKVIDLQTLTLHSKFPKPPPTNKENISVDEELSYNENEEFPQCKGIRRIGDYVVTLYSNLTMFIWGLDPQIHALRSIITHKSRIKTVRVLEEIKGDISFFSTISADNTLRVWHYYKKCFHNRQSIDIAELIGIKRNAYCRNLTRIIYTEAEIIEISGFLNQSIACISQKEFFMYSLENFQIVSHDTFSQNAIALDIRGNLAYIGFEDGKVCIFQVSDSLSKMRQIQFQTRIFSMKLIDDNIIVKGENQVVIYSLKRSSIAYIEKQATSFSGSGHHVFICKNDQSIVLYNTIKNKHSFFMSLKHQLDENESVIQICSNSWLVIFLTNQYKLIIGNVSSTIIHSQKLGEPINDISITENGQVLLVGDYGNIIIYKIVSDQKYQQMEDEMKNWIQKNDLSWMHGSVWSRRKSNVEEPQKLLSSVEKADSVRLGSDKSIGIMKVQLPNVEINYKSSQNSMSIFNPSNIAQQANNIYHQMNGIMKDKESSTDRDKSNKQSKRKIFGNKQKKIQEKEETLLLSNPAQRMKSEEAENVPRFNNNLVTSVVYSAEEKPVKRFPEEKPQEHSFQDFFEERQVQKKPQTIRQLSKCLDDENFLHENSEQLKEVYEKLEKHFKMREKFEKSVFEKYSALSREFMGFLEESSIKKN